jgi:hypothetical protein
VQGPALLNAQAALDAHAAWESEQARALAHDLQLDADFSDVTLVARLRKALRSQGFQKETAASEFFMDASFA